MFHIFRSKETPRPATVAILSDKTSSLMEATTLIKSVWQPEWSPGNTPYLLALAVNYQQKEPSSPLDAALAAYVAKTDMLLPSSTPMTAYQFDPTTAMSGNAWHHGREYELAVKGAPETILARCSLTEFEREEAHRMLASMASEGHQVIAAAHTLLQSPPNNLSTLSDMSFVGFVAAAYTPRPEARQVLGDTLRAGISVRIITGDHFETAFSIGRQLGLVARRSQVLDSRKLPFMNEEDREQAVRHAIIFARAGQKDKRDIRALLEKYYTAVTVSDTLSDLKVLTRTRRRS